MLHGKGVAQNIRDEYYSLFSSLMAKGKKLFANQGVLQQMLSNLLADAGRENSLCLGWVESARVRWTLDVQRQFVNRLSMVPL